MLVFDNKPPMSLEKIEKELSTYRPLLIEGYVHNPELDIPHFVLVALDELHLRPSIDKETKYTETSAGRTRSMIDLYRTCRGYYPDCTFAEVLEACLDHISNFRMGASYCGDIQRGTYWGLTHCKQLGSNINVNNEYINEFGIKGLHGLAALIGKKYNFPADYKVMYNYGDY